MSHVANARPLVSICIPTYNAEATITETLQSILAQTYPNFEVIISDNRSTDKTLDIVRSFNDPRITVTQNAVNIGGEANFEKCLKLGNGQYRAIYHSDDLYEPTIVAECVAYLEQHPEVGAVVPRAVIVNGDGSVFRNHWWPPQLAGNRAVGFEEGLRLVIRYGNPVITPGVMARSSVYEEVGTWNGAEFRTSADLDVWLRIMRHHRFGFLDRRLIRYRRGPNSFGYHDSRNRITEPDFIHVLRNYLRRPEVLAILKPSDHRNFRRQIRRNNAVRANIAHLVGRDDLARELLQGAFVRDAFVYAATSMGGLRVLGLSLLVRLDLLIPHSTRPLLRFVRERWW